MEKYKTDDISIDSIEQTYCFLHQKWNVYCHSTMDSQKDDIEYAISQYIQETSPSLYRVLSEGNIGFLCQHNTFSEDMCKALKALDTLMQTRQ